MPDSDDEYAVLVARAVHRVCTHPPRPSDDLLSGPPKAYFDWVVASCLQWYDEGTDVAIEAAVLLFALLLKARRETRVIAEEEVVGMFLRRTASAGREYFEAEMRTYEPHQWS